MMRRVRSLMLPALMATGLAGSAAEALAQGCYSSSVLSTPLETVYSLPTSYVTTSYTTPSILSTSVYTPTSFFTPTTAYLPTSVYYPTTYLRPTAYRYRPRASRVYLPTSYWDVPYVTTSARIYEPAPLITTSRVVYDSLLPTSYVVARPTTFVVPTSTMLLTSAVAPCDSVETVVTQPAIPVGVAPSRRPAIESTPSNVVPPRDEQAPSAALESTPTTESTYKAPAPKTPPPVQAAPATTTPPAQAPAATQKAEEKTPPDFPAGELPIPADPKTTDPTPPAGGFAPLPPVSSLGAGTTRRDSMRPSFSNSTATSRAILNGKVISRGSNRAEEGVKIVLQDQMNRFADRVVTTNAYGEFAVSLPTGDWELKVTMPSGNVLAVDTGPLTSSAGEVIDGSGVPVPLVTIRR
ncbi:hypothetical protein EP7_001433 [Isosphaeraceae bacterium EP7]